MKNFSFSLLNFHTLIISEISSGANPTMATKSPDQPDQQTDTLRP